MDIQNNLYFSWTDIYRDTLSLINKIKDNPWKKIIVVTRGGLIPAGIISQHLNIKYIETICISKEEIYKSILPIKDICRDHTKEEILIIDDAVESGNTFRIIREFIPEATYICLYCQPKGEKYVDLFIKSITSNKIMIFPWEI